MPTNTTLESYNYKAFTRTFNQLKWKNPTAARS